MLRLSITVMETLMAAVFFDYGLFGPTPKQDLCFGVLMAIFAAVDYRRWHRERAQRKSEEMSTEWRNRNS